MQCALLLGAAFSITYKLAGCYSSLNTLYIIPFNLQHATLKEEKYTLVWNKMPTHPPDMWDKLELAWQSVKTGLLQSFTY